MRVVAVLAHEYYGYRAFRGEYLSDYEKGTDAIYRAKEAGQFIELDNFMKGSYLWILR